MKTNTKTNTKSATLNISDRSVVQSLMDVMMDMNNRNDTNTNHCSTYGLVSKAISEFVFNQTGVSIEGTDWNAGGNRSYVDDIQEAIYDAVRTE